MAEPLTAAALAAVILTIWLALKHRQRTRRDETLIRAKVRGEISPDELRNALGKDGIELERQMLLAYASEVDEVRRKGIEEFNQLALHSRKVTGIRRDRDRAGVVLLLDNGWTVTVLQESSGLHKMTQALQRGPVRLEGAELEGRNVLLHFQSVTEGTEICVKAMLAEVTPI